VNRNSSRAGGPRAAADQQDRQSRDGIAHGRSDSLAAARPGYPRDISDQPILSITETAMQRIREYLPGEPAALALSVRVTGIADSQYTHALSIEARDTVRDDDAVQRVGDLLVAIPGADAPKLKGATVDWDEGAQSSGFVVLNPNAPVPAAALPSLPIYEPPAASPPPPERIGDLDSELAQRVQEILAFEINPSIASHGGRAELAGVEGSTAYLRLGGGCQGCGMASVTLRQGIEVAIMDAVPEITRIVDVTDHAAGANPFFEPAGR
jgi:Fe/S biogenesis protein NfuA